MNRSERRRLERVVEEVNNPVYYKISIHQIEKLRNDITAEIEDRLVKILFYIPLMVGKSKYDWTDEQCEMFANDIADEYAENFKGNEYRLEEYVAKVEKMTGMRFK